MKKCIFDKYNVTHLKIHHAVTLNEDIAQKLCRDGLHAVVLCTDASKPLTLSNIKETLKHLDFDLISNSMFILNLIHPVPAILPSVADAVEKLSVVYNIHIVNILLEVMIIEMKITFYEKDSKEWTYFFFLIGWRKCKIWRQSCFNSSTARSQIYLRLRTPISQKH